MDWNKLLYWIALQIEYSESRLDELCQMRAIVEGLVENDEIEEKKKNICAAEIIDGRAVARADNI